MLRKLKEGENGSEDEFRRLLEIKLLRKAQARVFGV